MATNKPIIPGVPTPSDPKCALTYCGRITAQVNCVTYIMQGTTACIDIQFFGTDDKPLNLNNFCDIHLQLFNELDCVVANFWYPAIPSGSKGFLIDILQYTDSKGVIQNEGLIRICLTADCTKTSPGALYAEILLTECASQATGNPTGVGPTGAPPSGTPEIFGIGCLQVGIILESRIHKNGGNTGCS